jgi:predicted nucleic acid-binding protein
VSGATRTIRAVFDASVILRAGLTPSKQAEAWIQRVATLEVRVHVPELVFAELAHVFRRHVAAGLVSLLDARALMDGFSRLPVRVHSQARFAEPALERALASGISGYDAFYVVLADAVDATLVTADRRLAGAYDRVELLG